MSRHQKITSKMCWGASRSPCAGQCAWRLVPEGCPESPIFSCDGHLAEAVRFMGVPAVVLLPHDDEP